jgi:ABC-type glycerol-3-phosphate transport system permease component
MSTLSPGIGGGRQPRGSRVNVPAAIVTIILIVLALAVIVPLFLPLLFVFKTRLEYSYNPWSLPRQIRWDNFVQAWKVIQLGKGMVNTLIVCLGAIACTVPPAACAGYIFARYRSRMTEVIFYVILAGYFVPLQMVLLPLYRMSVGLHLADTLPGVFLPMAAFGISFWTLIYRSFFRSLPCELAEAARIDGAGHWGTFFLIMLPLAGPATVLAVLLVFMSAWSDYLLSLIMISSQALFTMQLRVAQFLNAYGVDHMPRYSAAAIISAAPTLILYILGHRWILRGTLAGALKG